MAARPDPDRADKLASLDETWIKTDRINKHSKMTPPSEEFFGVGRGPKRALQGREEPGSLGAGGGAPRCSGSSWSRARSATKPRRRPPPPRRPRPSEAPSGSNHLPVAAGTAVQPTADPAERFGQIPVLERNPVAQGARLAAKRRNVVQRIAAVFPRPNVRSCSPAFRPSCRISTCSA